MLLRTLDEIREDIAFLAAAVTNHAITNQHRQYLDAFYAESVFSRKSSNERLKKPNLVPRKKINAYIYRVIGKDINVSKALDVEENLSVAYSGYIHAASENIMDLYGGSPPHFHVAGLVGSSRIASSVADTSNYFLRGLMTTIIVAKAFGDRPLATELLTYLPQGYSAESGSKGNET